MLPGSQSGYGLAPDFAVQAGVLFVLVLNAGRLYPTILE
jgi:hypothetical protein